MKRRIFILALLILTALLLSSCVARKPEAQEVYNVGGANFEILDYDFVTRTSIGVNGHSGSKYYGFYIEAESECSLIEYMVSLEFYSLEKDCIFRDTITSSSQKKARECFKIQLEISEEVYKNAYTIKANITGKTYEADKSTSPKTQSLEFYPVSYMDGSHLYGETRVKKGDTTETSKIPDPYKEDYIFCGWCLDSGLRQDAVFPLQINGSTRLYASWLRVKETNKCKDSKIKCWEGYSSAAGYGITPSGFDYERLSREGYSFKVKITYDVYYKKDYEALLDIGYAGAPKYEAYLVNGKGDYYGKSDLSTTTSSKTRTIEYDIKLSEMKNTTWSLEFSTDNIQNIIYFENIVVEFTCIK